MSDDNTDINIAATLRDIAAESPYVSEIIKKCQNAASEGKCSLKVRVMPQDHKCLVHMTWEPLPPPTPLIEKLRSFGFTVSPTYEASFWAAGEYNILKVSW